MPGSRRRRGSKLTCALLAALGRVSGRGPLSRCFWLVGGGHCWDGSVTVAVYWLGAGDCTRSGVQVLGRPSYACVLDDGGRRERQRLRVLILNRVDMCRTRRRGRRPPTVGEKGFFSRPGPPAVGTTPTDRTAVRQTSGPGSTIHADGDDNDAADDDDDDDDAICTRQQVCTQRRACCSPNPRLAACAHLERREAQTGERHPAGLLWAARCRLSDGVSPWPPALPRL
jgi:hypothetical protein